MKPRTEDEIRARSRREAALAFIRDNGPLPGQPPLKSRTCAHADSPRPCSCHLTLAQIAVAEELGNYTLFVFGVPYTGRIRVPYYPPTGFEGAPVVMASRAQAERTFKEATAYVTESAQKRHVAPLASSPEVTHVAAAAPSPSGDAARLCDGCLDILESGASCTRCEAKKSRAPLKFDPVYNSAYAKARRRGPEAVAAFKAEWAAKKATA